MKCISVQLQADRDQSFEVSDFLDLVKSIGRYPEVETDEKDSSYVNLNFFTEDLKVFWTEFSEKVLHDPVIGSWIQNVAIIVCEGDQGWDNYLLLWHFDKSEKTDQL